jgi:CYTH domain-containing protein
MAIEIERKFLVINDGWKSAAAGVICRQGYIPATDDFSVRIRTADDKAFIAVKQRRTGIARAEYEYAIPLSDAAEMLASLERGGIVEKVRYEVPFEGLTWEVDVFGGDNKGLIVAEVELTSEEQPIVLPGWVGQEVTDDPRYLNVNLSKYPYSLWRE